MKRYEGARIRITVFRRGGYYILHISTYSTFHVATKNSRKAHLESGWAPEFIKKFEDKDQANRYFRAVKKNHPDLRLVEDAPNKYISYDGTVKEY